MATIAARLAKLEQRRPPTPSRDAFPERPESWLELAVVLAGMAEIGYIDLVTGQWTLPGDTDGPMFPSEFTDGIPVYLTAGKLRQEMGVYFAAAPQDDAGRPFYDWLAGALNQQPTAAR